jgi:hypothetical protein
LISLFLGLTPMAMSACGASTWTHLWQVRRCKWILSFIAKWLLFFLQMLRRHAIYFSFSLAEMLTWVMAVSWWSHLQILWTQLPHRGIVSHSTICMPPSHIRGLVANTFCRYHTNLSSVQYNVFFNLCRLKGVHFDLRERCGSAFVLLDSFSGGTVRFFCFVFFFHIITDALMSIGRHDQSCKIHFCRY